MNYKSFNLGDWIGHISGVIEDESELDGNEMRDLVEFLATTLNQQPCEDCISRQEVINAINQNCIFENEYNLTASRIKNLVQQLPSVTPKEKTGKWLRMSDLSEQEDDRYKCSHCGNVVHYTNKINLYTFNSWCGRCGSDNGARMVEPQESEDKE